MDSHPEWKTALEAVDEHWNPEWPADWQRHYAALHELVRDEEGQADVLPGVTVHGMDIGKWLAKQRQHTVWARLMDEQRDLLETIGVVPRPPEQETPTKTRTALGAFERGIAALTQHKEREGHMTVPRGHVEELPDGTEVRLGVWIMNQKGRRSKLTADKLRALADLGLEWATVPGGGPEVVARQVVQR
ncbi:helicase associated domain-containing protein [Streptomyces sp. NPDC127178]|uniref:helicase associated domain-containing protein n=1 Tax=unclassified Streptomyces TaxID=2593676 RepID=UPI003627F388